jgi:hypothetical protein
MVVESGAICLAQVASFLFELSAAASAITREPDIWPTLRDF